MVFGCVGLAAWAIGWDLSGSRLPFALMASNLTALLSMAAIRFAVGWQYSFGPHHIMGIIARGEPGSSAVTPSLCVFLVSAMTGVVIARRLRNYGLSGVVGLVAIISAAASVVAGAGFFVGAMVDTISGPNLVEDGGATTGMLLGGLIGIYIWRSKFRSAGAVATTIQASAGAMSREEIRDALVSAKGKLVGLRLK